MVYALLPNQYKATALLAPAQSDSGGLPSSLNGSVASVIGRVSLDGGGGSESQIAQEIMRSRSFIEAFVEKNDMAVELSAVIGWSKQSNELLINQEAYDSERNEWLTIGEGGVIARPSNWDLFKSFAGMTTISADNNTGLISVSIEYYSPQIAKEWVDMYVAAINDYMQKRQVERVQNNIEYLEAQIAKTSISQMQEVFYTIIEEQIKTKMLAEASPDYVFVTVSPAMVPAEKSTPKRASICILGTILGGILAFS